MTSMNRTRLQKCATLPTFPAVALKVAELCQTGETSINEVADVIATDPALAARLLRMANSPVLGLRQPISKVSQAVGVLGLNAVRAMALSLSLAQTMTGKQPWFPRFWKRSALTATAAREIANMLSKAQREEAFLTGLLQDIGILALSRIDSIGYDGVADGLTGTHEQLIARERQAYGCDHAKVGAWLVENWQLPAAFSKAVMHSHDPAQSVDLPEDTQHLVRIGAAAAHLADIWMDVDCPKSTARARSAAWDLLGMSDEQFSTLLESMKQSIAEVTVLLEQPIGPQDEIESLLQEAREALLVLSIAEAKETNDKKSQGVGNIVPALADAVA